jgi:hypothetical protein
MLIRKPNKSPPFISIKGLYIVTFRLDDFILCPLMIVTPEESFGFLQPEAWFFYNRGLAYAKSNNIDRAIPNCNLGTYHYFRAARNT